ncbi:amidophosphoribosyltransferase [Flavobacterium okayamense]|uniref:Amidophosphoribosyltransferase n=1 Tax=Flavobacterium okayamense TaxID=2830782 RepID=A0ABN6HXX9_9FLAO|nr:amidophosphoribosyltransferase [Flavobacterium okayamense]
MLKNLINLIYPQTCFGCKNLLLKNEKTLCSDCLHELPKTYHHNIFENDLTKKFYGIIPIEFGASFLYFKSYGIVKEIIHNLKYRDKQEIGTLLGNLYAYELKEVIEQNNITEIIPVPLHPKRLKKRGYNQVTTFCVSLSENLNIPLNESLLVRNLYTETQTHKDKVARQYQTNLFEARFSEQDCGKHFLLVDDVITTGATLEKCANALLKIPNSKVSIVTIAFTQS